MVVQIDYRERIPWMSAQNYQSRRPYSMVTVHGNGSTAWSGWAILDTGADYSMFHFSVARILRFRLPSRSYPVKRVYFADGSSAVYPLATVKMTLKQKTVKADVLFSPNIRTPLIGRTTIERAIQFGLDWQGWLYEVRSGSGP